MAMSRDLGLSLVHKGTQLVKLKISKLLRFWIFNVGPSDINLLPE